MPKLQHISDYFVRRFRLKDYSQINQGRCYYWGYVVHKLYDAQLFTFPEKGMHAFVKIGNDYYDAQRPEGVKTINDLPFFMCIKDLSSVREHTSEQFIYYWSTYGKKGFKLPLANSLILQISSRTPKIF